MERGPSLVTAFQTGRGIQWQTLCCRVETGPHFVLQYGRAGLAHPLTSISLPKYEIMVSLSLECFFRGWGGGSSRCDDLVAVSPTCSHCQGSALHHWTNTGSHHIQRKKGYSIPRFKVLLVALDLSSLFNCKVLLPGTSVKAAAAAKELVCTGSCLLGEVDLRM